jgi:hypothetical protein
MALAGVSLGDKGGKNWPKELYDVAYRLYSWHMHAVDFHEHLRVRLGLASDLEETLVPAVLEITCECVAAVILECNEWTGNPLETPADDGAA